MSPVAFSIAVVIALGTFSAIMAGRARRLLAAGPAPRFDHVGERLRRTAVYAFGQLKFLKGEQPAGLMHAFIFWGFMTLGLTVVTLFGRAWSGADFYLPLLHPGQPLGDIYTLVRDLIQVTVVIAVLYALYRRLIEHTPRLFGFEPAEKRLHDEPHWEGILILCLILGIMVGSLLHEGARLVEYAGQSHTEAERGWEPVSNLVSHLIPAGAANTMVYVGMWMHNLIVLTFLNLLPLSKHFHIITAVPNVFFGSVRPRGQLSKTDPGDPDHFTWKQVLDMYSCTECGRCSAACPATASGSPLAPRQLILDLRDNVLGRTEPVDGKIVSDEVLWSCTTCMACVEACPVGIEHVPTIVQGRRKLVDQGAMEPMLQDTLQNFAQQGNSYGKSSRMRARWTKGLEFKIPDARKEPVKYLWFVGDFASFDERSQEASRRVARILHHAGVSFGILYEGERNAGNDVRRVGEEGLFELLVEQNMEAFAGAEFEAIFTTDPHSLNTLKNEYSEFGDMKPVYHYTELLVELIESGQIALPEPVGARVTYHDPCYLARYNRITDAPRRLLTAVGAELLEMPRHGTNTFCCGAGGGRIWMDDSKLVERPSEQRVKEASALGDLDHFVVSCPKDLAMYTDAATTVGAGFSVLEVSALVERAMGLGEAQQAVLAGDAAV